MKPFRKEADHTIGAYSEVKDLSFQNSIDAVFESVRTNNRMDPMEDAVKMMKSDVIAENFRNDLFGDVSFESLGGDSHMSQYLGLMSSKLDQLYENTRYEIIKENVGTLNPIVGYTMPILKKSFLECHSKDIVLTEVAPAPIINSVFERKFLRDAEGNKYYIPDIYYDDTFADVMPKAMGKPIPTTINTLPLHQFDVLGAAGGSIAMKDELSGDFIIEGIEYTLDGATLTLDGLRIVPNKGARGQFSYDLKVTDAAGQEVTDTLTGRVDFYNGRVSANSSNAVITGIKFAGHLSNQYNYRSLEFDREREPITWEIGEGVRFNTGMTLEKIKDTQALATIDIMAETIADMSETMAQYEDSHVLKFLDDSYNAWRKRDIAPFGYKEGFTETYQFDLIPPTTVIKTTSEWIPELKFKLNRQMDKLKEKLRTDKIMFVVYGNPAHITLLEQAGKVDWIIDNGSRVGGVQLEYRFGAMSNGKSRIHVVSSMKVGRDKGLRVVAYPTTREHTTFKHLKYSVNISNEYRNPLTPLVPNLMGANRFLTTELTPVQGEMRLKNADFGRITDQVRLEP